MAWQDRFTGPVASGSKGQKYQARVAIRVRKIDIDAPMTDGPYVLAPSAGIDLHYAVDLHQRIYSANINQREQDRTIFVSGALYSAPEYGGGEPPDGDSTWTVIADSLFETNARVVTWLRQSPPWFDGLTHVDLWSSVYQPPVLWTKPFTIVHELWANFVTWNRTPKDVYALEATSSEPRPAVRDKSIRILSKQRG